MFPVVIVEDRYQGTYTGYKWLAFPNFDSYYSYERDLVEGVWGDDVSAADWAFKKSGSYWGGDTPEEALKALQAAHSSGGDDSTESVHGASKNSNAKKIDASSEDLGIIRYDDLAI